MISDGTIFLRALEREDLERTWRWVNDPAVYEPIGLAVPISRHAQELWYEGLIGDSSKRVFAICRQRGETHIGNVALDQIDQRHRTTRLSIFIGSEDDRGDGFGARAVRLAVVYAFDHLNIERVYVKTNADRPDLIRFYERLGFQTEGRLRSHEFLAGERRDKTVLGLLRGELSES